MTELGQIVILNGAPRSGKSSIVAAIQENFDGVWINLGVDRYMPMIPPRLQPGIGLRPGGERPDLEPLVALLYRALYASIAAHEWCTWEMALVSLDPGYRPDPRWLEPTFQMAFARIVTHYFRSGWQYACRRDCSYRPLCRLGQSH
jgi:hypothetical protein